MLKAESPMRHGSDWLGKAAVTVVILGACRAHPQAPVSVTVRADTTVVTNASPVWRKAREMRRVSAIGGSGSDDYLIERITAFAIDKADNAYIADLNRPLRSYDAAGRFVRVVAREGAGPGEVRVVTSIVGLPEGGLAVRDQGNGRINVYDPAGRPVSQWPLPQMGGYGLHGLNVDTAGRVYITVNPAQAEDGSPTEWPRPVYIRFGPGGTISDTVWAPRRYTEQCPVLSDRRFRAGWFEDLRWTYIPKPTWALTTSGDLVIGCPATGTFEVIAATGHITRVLWRAPRVTASHDEREYFKKITVLGQRHMMKDWTWSGPELPSTKPAYLRIIPAADGRLWVWRPQPRRQADGGWQDVPGGTFAVFQRDGRYLGEVRVPAEVEFQGHPGTPDPYIRGDTIWAVTHDADDVESLTRFVLRETGAQ
jgi:hypothetical protein